MCDVLNIPRSTYYYESKIKENQPDEFTNDVINAFKDNRKAYGTRRIKKYLAQKRINLSRRRIGRIMRINGLVSSYTLAKYKIHKDTCNEAKVANIVDRNFDNKERLDVVVSDLTYVRVKGKWNYICLMLDLYNREIVGYSAGIHKDAHLVYEAFASIKHDLSLVKIFHTDRGNEFKNNVIDGLLDTFSIERSLSKKGCPYDNAVAEATFKTFKKEFVYQKTFESLDRLKRELFDFVNWYNNHRLHSSLGYMSPVDYKYLQLKKVV
jgi:transposase InsO family protein